MERVITYIDGFNLYHGLRSKYGRKYIWLDIEKLSQQLLHNGQSLEKVKYFTAMIRDNPSKEFRQKTYISALSTLSKVEIYYGKYLVNQHICPNCNYVENIPSEKMTDVNIATHIMTDAFTDKYDVAFIITADSDLTGPIQTVKELFSKKKIVVAFPPDRVSLDLIRIAPAFIHIGRRKLETSQLPNEILLNNNTRLVRPVSWH